jgi:hypothetical protein
VRLPRHPSTLTDDDLPTMTELELALYYEANAHRLHEIFDDEDTVDFAMVDGGVSRRPWRAGWLGRLLKVHSPSAHAAGKCWCQVADSPRHTN